MARRRKKRVRGALTGVGGWLAKQAIKLGIASKPARRTKHKDVFGVCPAHLSDELLAQLGFLDRSSLVAYAEAATRRGLKPKKSVTLPREKRPLGMLKVVLRRCPKCSGRAGAICDLCSGWGWGAVLYTRRPREPKPKPAAPSPVVSTEAPR